MTAPHPQPLPLGPLLHRFVVAGLPHEEELGELPGIGPRCRALRMARQGVLDEASLDRVSEATFTATLLDFYQQCAPYPLHMEAIRRRAGILRHGLAHLLRGADPLPRKLEHCLAADGPYHVSGMGPAFWSALVQGLDPARHAAWTPTTVLGLTRLGLARWRPHHRPARIYAAIQAAHAQIRERVPFLSALQIEYFLSLVALMEGRELDSGKARLAARAEAIPEALRQERARLSLRRRLKEQGAIHHEARRALEQGLAAHDGGQIRAALALLETHGALPPGSEVPGDAAALALWVDRLWQAEDPYAVLEAFWRSDPLPGASLSVPTLVLSLRDAARFQPWNDVLRQGYARLDDSLPFAASAGARYRLFNEGIAALCAGHAIHPLEMPSLLARLARHAEHGNESRAGETYSFSGFCADTFCFLADLGANNHRTWMEQQRQRYRFAVREPLVELCRTLAQSYIEPVLQRTCGWPLETAARTGRSLTSICKNDYGRSVPYHTSLWITFYRSGGAPVSLTEATVDAPSADPNAPAESAATENPRGRDGVQFFVRLEATGVCYGLRVVAENQEAARRFQQRIAEQSEMLYRLLDENGAIANCRFGEETNPEREGRLDGPETLRSWAGGRALVAYQAVPVAAPLACARELVGDILLTFERLLPLFACAVEVDPQAWLARRQGCPAQPVAFSTSDFCRATFLKGQWLSRARSLLDLKRQLVLQGVPGTGKTHVARHLALLLTEGREEAVRLVQFHPAYSYEEFVEGIRVRSVEVQGRQEVTYPVEDGLLGAFAAEASRQPGQAHVLIIDEMNRGNLPRIFGELLYLLEYRSETVRLLYSKRAFQLPPNLYLIGTMNAADRSVALLDQALRRRFSFLEMPPDAALLEAWLEKHPPAVGAEFTGQVVALFDRLNTRLRRDLGPAYQIGHSYFMVPELDRSRLEMIWEHHVLPLLAEYFHGHPEQVAAYALEQLFAEGRRPPTGRKRRAARLPR